MTSTILFLSLILGHNICISISDPLVKLPNGWIRGREDRTVRNNHFYAFEKIPYAAPPIGELRFKPPQPPQNWEGILNTTRLDKICYQLTRKGPESEDCLYLNVFTPKLPDNNENEIFSLPVMFYVHGGGFYDGTAMVLGPDRFIDSGVIFVTINYRLGPFGFLSTGDSLIHGNNGLKDTVLALRWVHDNIRLFGGDPDRVTIVGHSSGAASVSYLLVNKKTEGLYDGIICQSGTVLGSWAFQRNPRNVAFAYAQFLNKTFPENFNDTFELVEYIQQAPAKELKEASYKYYFEHLFKENPEELPTLQGHYFAPVLESEHPDAFITEKMYKLLTEGRFVKVPLMIGYTSEECLEYFRDHKRSTKVLNLYDKNLDWLVPSDMPIENKFNKTEMGRLIRKLYTEGEPFSEHIYDALRFCSDNLLTRPIMKQAELHSRFAKTYFYVFSYDGKLGNIDVHLDGGEKVGHGEENKYLICGYAGSKCDLSDYPEEDKLTSKRLIKLWTDFAKYRNPTPERSSLLQNITWPELSVEEGDFLYLDIDVNLTIRNHPSETYQRWNELYSSLEYDDFDTY